MVCIVLGDSVLSLSLSLWGWETGDSRLPEMFKYVEPIYKFHVGFLKEVEQRLAMWYV